MAQYRTARPQSDQTPESVPTRPGDWSRNLEEDPVRQRSNLIIVFGIAFFLIGGVIVYLVINDDADDDGGGDR